MNKHEAAECLADTLKALSGEGITTAGYVTRNTHKEWWYSIFIPGGDSDQGDYLSREDFINKITAALEASELKATRRKLKPGVQIVYVPSHAMGDVNHPDSEAGFVEKVVSESVVLCRYWRTNDYYLRTSSCGERTPIENIVVKDTRPQALVDSALRAIQEQEI